MLKFKAGRIAFKLKLRESSFQLPFKYMLCSQSSANAIHVFYRGTGEQDGSWTNSSTEARWNEEQIFRHENSSSTFSQWYFHSWAQTSNVEFSTKFFPQICHTKLNEAYPSFSNFFINFISANIQFNMSNNFDPVVCVDQIYAIFLYMKSKIQNPNSLKILQRYPN